MEKLTSELRRLEDLKASKLISEEEFVNLRRLVMEGAGETRKPADNEGALAEHFAKEQLRKHQKWRGSYEEFCQMEETWREEDTDSKQELWINLAKAGGVTQMERLLAFYGLFGTNADIKFFSSLLALCPDSKRILYHNWYVARAIGETFLVQHGQEISELEVPLFPPIKEMGALNTQVLRESLSGGEISAGGCWREAGMKDPGAEKGGAGGNRIVTAAGYAIPVVDGYVDVTIVEDAVGWLDARVKQLEAAIVELKADPPAPPRQQPQRRQQGGYQGYQQGYYQQGYHGNPGRGRGGYRGRGGRGRPYQGNY